MNFKGKTVVITGVSSGVGKTAVILFTKHGADVVGIARREEKLEEVLSIVHKNDDKVPGNGSFTPVVGDVTNPDDVERLFNAAIAKTGKVDVLVNNAGMMDKFTPVGNMSDDLWYSVLKLNLTAPMQTMKKAVNIMKTQENGGVIVNVGSIAGIAGGVGGAAYTASKHGLAGLSKNTAVMYRNSKIRCNMISPGGIETPMASDAYVGKDEFGYGQLEKLLMARTVGISPAEEIANVILFLASDLSASITGDVIPVDLGYTAQ